MNDLENRERVQGQPSVPDAENKNNHAPATIGVYDRPERRGPSLWYFVILAVLLVVAAVIIFQLLP
jgi:hypothetical protein